MMKGWSGMSRMKLNLGPQHPSTHGVLRLILDVDGEKISGIIIFAVTSDQGQQPFGEMAELVEGARLEIV